MWRGERTAFGGSRCHVCPGRGERDGRPDKELLTYQYLQQLPKIAAGDSSKLWIIPNEVVQAIDRLGSQQGSGAEPGPSASR